MLFYRVCLERRIALTVHNVNAARRDAKDTFCESAYATNPISISTPHLVYTQRMKDRTQRGVWCARGPSHGYPVGNQQCGSEHLPHSRVKLGSALAFRQTKRRFCSLAELHHTRDSNTLLTLFNSVLTRRDDCRLIIAGRPKNCRRDTGAQCCEAIHVEAQKGASTAQGGLHSR